MSKNPAGPKKAGARVQVARSALALHTRDLEGNPALSSKACAQLEDSLAMLEGMELVLSFQGLLDLASHLDSKEQAPEAAGAILRVAAKAAIRMLADEDRIQACAGDHVRETVGQFAKLTGESMATRTQPTPLSTAHAAIKASDLTAILHSRPKVSGKKPA